MLFSTPKTKGGLRSDSLGDSSKITPSIWETRWPAAETKKKKIMLENYQKAERNPYLLTIPKRSI